MMDFPNTPTLNQIETIHGRNYKWNGTAWDVLPNDPLANYAGAPTIVTLGTVSTGTVPWGRLGSIPTVPTSGLTMNTNSILGRTTASAGAVEELTIGSGLSVDSGVLSASGGAPDFLLQSYGIT